MSNPKKPLFSFKTVAVLFLAAVLMNACKPAKAPVPSQPPAQVSALPGSVVFVQRGHLARLDLATSQVTPLTGGTSVEWFPACSPKGNQVAYWSNADGTVYNLWKINLDGTGRTRLTYDESGSLRTNDQNLLINDAPAWSAEGDKILYTSGGDLWTVDANGYNNETLLIDHSALCPAFSPDGKSVIFVSNLDDTAYNIWQLGVSDKNLTKLTSYTDWNVGSPSFSKDGSRIFINLYRSNVSQLYTLKADGTDPVKVAVPASDAFCPRYAQGDKKILYCALGSDKEGALNVFLSALIGGEGKALTSEGGTSPSWSPGPLPAPASSK